MAIVTSQKVVLITGCSAGGIGFALCEEFAARGCIVYATARRLESMEGFRNPNIRKHVLDVTNGDHIECTVRTILAETGKIDILVNNAGAAPFGPVVETTIDEIRNAFELNTFGALRLSNAVIPSMFKRKEGLIVNIGSILGLITTPWHAVYCASKAALHSITEGLAMECKPFGVNVMLVAPGGVKSNIVNNLLKNHANWSLSPTSMYKHYEPQIVRQIGTSQSQGSMDTKEFARKVAAQALLASPPPYMTLGLCSTLYYIFQWLPRQFALWVMCKELINSRV